MFASRFGLEILILYLVYTNTKIDLIGARIRIEISQKMILFWAFYQSLWIFSK